MISLEDAKSQMGVACAHVRGLEDALSEARRQRDAAEASLKLLVQVSEEPSNDKLTVVALRERIANYARAHETGTDDIYWHLFRAALAELARRAEVTR